MEYTVPLSPINDQNVSKMFPKTCMVCFKTNNSKSQKDLFDLWLADNEEVTLMDKLQTFLQEKLWVNEYTVLCENCIKDLNEACHFRKRLVKSQEIWKTAILPALTSNLSNQTQELSDSTLNSSINKVSNKEVNNFTTPICSYEIEVGSENLKAADLAKESLSYYICKNCDAVFANSSEFSEHKCEQNATQDTLSVIDSSGEESDSKTDLLIKNTAKKKLRKLIFQCDLCGKKFKNLHGKNGHKVKVHFQERVFSCTFCNKSFKQKYHLKEHLTSHTGEKNYLCSICDKTFQRISSQRRHMRSHEMAPGQKVKQTPFLCSICGKSFPFSNGVQRHMRVHTGERKYECNLCGKKFMQSTHLHVHLRTHTGERPYSCNFCRESFALKSTLQKHFLNSHNSDKN